MKLATAQEVADRASTSISGSGPTTTIDSALEAVTGIVENLLDCSLARNTRLDIFTYKIPAYRGAFAPFKFYLSSGFLDATVQAVEVRYSNDGSRLGASGEGEILDSTIYDVDADKGHITFYQDVTQGYGSVSVFYGNGFEVKDGMVIGIPDWMKDAAISATIRMVEAHSTLSKKKDARAIKNELASHVAMQINNHYRRAYEVNYPVRTVIV